VPAGAGQVPVDVYQVPQALWDLLSGAVVPPSTVDRVAPLVLDVICAQDTTAVDKCRDAIARLLMDAAQSSCDKLAARAIRALSSSPLYMMCTRWPCEVVSNTELDAVLTAALRRFLDASDWAAAQDTLETVVTIQRHSKSPMCTNLLQVGVRVVTTVLWLKDAAVKDHRASWWRYAAMLAWFDRTDVTLTTWCEFWVGTVSRMLGPCKEDLHGLEPLTVGLYRGRPEDERCVVTRARSRKQARLNVSNGSCTMPACGA
jgi:hypothetical protein